MITKNPEVYLLVGFALGLASTVAFPVEEAQANSREADVSRCMAEGNVPVQSASSHMQVICIDPKAVIWIR